MSQSALVERKLENALEFNHVVFAVAPVPPSATAKAVPSVNAPDMSALPSISKLSACNSPVISTPALTVVNFVLPL